MRFTGERVVPWASGQHARLMVCHTMRYAWAMRYVDGRGVVDLGCGSGYGSFMLSWVAARVIGVDVDAHAVAYARNHFRAANLSYEVANVETDRIPRANVYTALEVLEHLDNPGALLERLEGRLVWSLPVNNGNVFHRHVLSIAQIRELIPGKAWYQAPTGEITTEIPSKAKDGYVIGITG